MTAEQLHRIPTMKGQTLAQIQERNWRDINNAEKRVRTSCSAPATIHQLAHEKLWNAIAVAEEFGVFEDA